MMGLMPSPHESDKAVVVLVLFLTGSVAAEFVSALVFGSNTWWAVVPFIVLVLVWLVINRGGLFDRKRLGTSPLSVILPVVLVGAYMAVSMYGAGNLSLPTFLIATTCLTVATAGVVWRNLTQQTPGLFVLTGITVLLFGAAALLVGAALLHTGTTLTGVAIVLGGVASLLLGVALLRDANVLFGLGVLLFGAGFLLLGAVVLQNGNTLTGLAILLAGSGAMLAGVATLRGGTALFGLAALLAGVAFLLLGTALLRDENTLIGLAALLGGTAALLAGVAALTDSANPRSTERKPNVIFTGSHLFRRASKPQDTSGLAAEPQPPTDKYLDRD